MGCFTPARRCKGNVSRGRHGHPSGADDVPTLLPWYAFPLCFPFRGKLLHAGPHLPNPRPCLSPESLGSSHSGGGGGAKIDALPASATAPATSVPAWPEVPATTAGLSRLCPLTLPLDMVARAAGHALCLGARRKRANREVCGSAADCETKLGWWPRPPIPHGPCLRARLSGDVQRATVAGGGRCRL